MSNKNQWKKETNIPPITRFQNKISKFMPSFMFNFNQNYNDSQILLLFLLLPQASNIFYGTLHCYDLILKFTCMTGSMSSNTKISFFFFSLLFYDIIWSNFKLGLFAGQFYLRNRQHFEVVINLNIFASILYVIKIWISRRIFLVRLSSLYTSKHLKKYKFSQ